MVRSVYEQYLSGASLRMIKERLETEQIPNVTGGSQWTITAIRSILTNEKYCGDVLLQKTYISDCISRKVIRNTGQLPMYLVQNHHEGIVERKTFDAVQAEMARRSAGKSPSKKNAPTGMTSYASKYALSAANAAPCIAAAPGPSKAGSALCGAVSAGWTTAPSTATTHQHWTRNRSRGQSSPQSTPS